MKSRASKNFAVSQYTLLPISLAAVALLSCGKVQSAEVASSSNISPAQTTQTPEMGQGYNSKAQELRGSCVEGTEVSVGGGTSSLDLAVEKSRDTVAKELGIDLKGKAKYGVGSAAAAIKAVKTASSDEMSFTATYGNNMIKSNTKLSKPKLSALGSKSRGPDFERICGDEFVIEKSQGASLYMTMRISFRTKNARAAYAAKVKVTTPTYALDASASSAVSEFSDDAVISIKMTQFGGQPQKLAAALTGLVGNDILADKNAVSAVTRCSFKDLAACNDIYNNFLTYATSTRSTDSFVGQLNDSKNWKDTAWVTTDYLSIGQVANIVLDKAVIATRGMISDEYDRMNAYSERLDDLKALPIDDATESSRLETLRKDVAENMNLLVESAKVCFEDAQNCVSSYADTVKKLKSIQESELEVKGLTPPPPPPAPPAPPAPTPVQYCSDVRANNINAVGRCWYGAVIGHASNAPGAIYVWPSPWSTSGYVWCGIPNHPGVLLALQRSHTADINYMGHDVAINKWNAQYWGQDCTDLEFQQGNL